MREEMELKLVLPLPVSVNALYKQQFSWNNKMKKQMPTGKKILSPEGRKTTLKIQRKAREQLAKQDWDYEYTKDNFIYQDMVVYFNRKGRDSDNLYKNLLDSLEGIVFYNDSKVLTRTQKVLFDPNNPRVELTYAPVDFVGIFNDREEAIAFKSVCKGCVNYRNERCSILQDSFGGKVRQEITIYENGYDCSKYEEKKG